MSLCSRSLATVLGHVAWFTTEQTEFLIQHCLSCCVRLTLAPNLGARSEDGFRVSDVLVLAVLDPEVPDFSPLLPFLFTVVWA